MDSNMIVIVVVLIAVLAVAFLLLTRKNDTQPELPARPETPAAPAAAPAAAAPAPRPAAAPAAPAPSIEAGIPPEVVAAIAAAVYAMGEGRYVLRAVRRAGREAWAQAGAAEATTPF